MSFTITVNGWGADRAPRPMSRATLADARPFEYSRQQIADGIGVLVVVTVGLIGIATLLLGAVGL